MGIAMREYDDVALRQLHWLFARNARPALSLRDDVVADQMLGTGEHRIDNRLSLRGFRHPWPRCVHIEENGAGEAHRSQHI